MNAENWLALVSLHLVASQHFGYARPRPDAVSDKVAMPNRLTSLAQNVRFSVDYMLRYGYLSEPAPGSSAVRDLSTLQSALQRLQRFNHLEVTGEMDEATERLLTAKRCGVSDMQTDKDLRKKRRHYSRSKRYVLHPHSWPDKSLTFKIDNTASSLSMRDARPLLLEALVVWQRASGLKFKETRSNRATIQMSFERIEHEDGYPFSSEDLAHAFFPIPDNPLKGDIHFNDDYTWSKERYIAPSSEIRLLQVAIHEVGHALGLQHSEAIGSVMKPVYEQDDNPVLGSDDIQGIQARYGKPDVRTTTNKPTTIKTAITKPFKATTRRPNPTRWKLVDFRTTASYLLTGKRNNVRSRQIKQNLQHNGAVYNNQTAQEEEGDIEHIQGNRVIKIFDEDRIYVEFEIEDQNESVHIFSLHHADGTETTITLYRAKENHEWVLNVDGDDYDVSDFEAGNSITIEHEGETDTVIEFS